MQRDSPADLSTGLIKKAGTASLSSLPTMREDTSREKPVTGFAAYRNTLHERELRYLDSLLQRGEGNSYGQATDFDSIRSELEILKDVISKFGKKMACFFCKPCSKVFMLGESTAPAHGFFNDNQPICGQQKVYQYIENLFTARAFSSGIKVVPIGLVYCRGKFECFNQRITLWCQEKDIDFDQKAARVRQVLKENPEWITIFKNRLKLETENINADREHLIKWIKTTKDKGITGSELNESPQEQQEFWIDVCSEHDKKSTNIGPSDKTDLTRLSKALSKLFTGSNPVQKQQYEHLGKKDREESHSNDSKEDMESPKKPTKNIDMNKTFYRLTKKEKTRYPEILEEKNPLLRSQAILRLVTGNLPTPSGSKPSQWHDDFDSATTRGNLRCIQTLGECFDLTPEELFAVLGSHTRSKHS